MTIGLADSLISSCKPLILVGLKSHRIICQPHADYYRPLKCKNKIKVDTWKTTACLPFLLCKKQGVNFLFFGQFCLIALQSGNLYVKFCFLYRQLSL